MPYVGGKINKVKQLTDKMELDLSDEEAACDFITAADCVTGIIDNGVCQTDKLFITVMQIMGMAGWELSSICGDDELEYVFKRR